MKNLVIVESPSKSKTIEKYLGKDYKVVSSKGHIRDLAIKGKGGLGIDIENDFKPTYVISDDKEPVVRELKKYSKAAEHVYLATDPDREGEAISWHLAQVLDLPLDDNNRIEFNEITKNAVLKALDNPRSIDISLVKSQETRRILDRIIGFKLSNLLQRKIKSQSAGRVQSVALRIICDREHEIEAFIPEEYWTISLDLIKDNKKLNALLVKINDKKANIKDKDTAEEIIKKISPTQVLTEVESKKKKRAPYLPFITSTLQQEASSKLGFSSKKTMQIAQCLYEGINIGKETQGLITYMRTDSTRLSNDFVNNAFNLIESKYGKEYVGKYRIKNSDNTQDAHEAIRPTSLANDPDSIKEYLSNDQYKLYSFIYYRALASLMSDSVNLSVSYDFKDGDLLFSANGSTVIFDGFLKVYDKYDSSKEVKLPDFKQGDILDVEKINKEQHFTEAPSRYTEARLIKALEEDGVGRPSTYATIIETILKREYVVLKKASDNSKTKVFFPTEQGLLTDDKLKEYFKDFINVEYTAKMEKKLDEIAGDKEDSLATLKEFYGAFEPLLENAYNHMEKVGPKQTGEVCPVCGSPMVLRKGKYGTFEACSNYPTCTYIKHEQEPEEDLGTCPECGGKLVSKQGKYGKFIGCSNYPKCHYIKDSKKKEKKATPLGRICPECGGQLVIRSSKRGDFIACSNFPKCRHTEKIENGN